MLKMNSAVSPGFYREKPMNIVLTYSYHQIKWCKNHL